ncbi:MAG: LPS assembly lipoprotein LptE [Prevotellaceae bacterium]|jgi:hypothetical protein|nr:LPS assembly lipoprotein LptE [Prevotellaceae bacterium]
MILIIIGLCLQSCGIYSFTGTSLSPDVKTISVEYFQNMAPLVAPSLSSSFTDALKDQFIRYTKLQQVRSEGDLQFSGEIRGYDVAPSAITGDEVASKNRLSIRVHVKFVNMKDELQNFEKDFSAYEEFPGEQSLDAVQGQLIEKIVKTLVENIFNASVANW